MSSIERAFIEVRPFLGCANVFLEFNEPCSGNGIKVHLEESKIRLRNEDHYGFVHSWEIVFNEHFNIVSNSLNNVTVDDKNVTFRLSIDNVSKALLERQQNDNDSVEMLKAMGTTIMPVIQENQKISYFCNSCENFISSVHSYKCICPLPSTFIPSSEFFCHIKLNCYRPVVPRIGDLYCGYQYIIVNRDIFLNDEMTNIESKNTSHDDNLYCHKCLKLIGIKMFDGKGIKLWSDSVGVKFHADNSINCNNKICNIFPKLNTLSDACNLLIKILREYVIGVNTRIAKIQVIIRTISLSDPQQYEYLLIYVYERDLKVLQYNLDKSIQDNNDKRIIQLQYNKALKVYFTHKNPSSCPDQVDDNDSESKCPILDAWNRNGKVMQVDVSPYLVRDFINELQMNVSIFPKEYQNLLDGFQISCVIY